MTFSLGIDHGGTRTKLLLLDDASSAPRVVRQDSVDTREGAASLVSLAGTVERFLAGARIGGFGITIAGILEEDSGLVRTSVNMPWLSGTRPAVELAGLLGTSGVAVHDGAAAASAEATLGAGRDHRDVFVIALGTGIAGAHVVDGVVRRGAHGAAGEIGHVPLGGSRACSCGQRGCLESEIGGARLASRWIETGRASADATAEDLVSAAASGDLEAVTILDEATSALARSILGIVAVVDPGAIVIGGGLAGSPEWILDPMRAKVAAEATFHRVPPIIRAELGVWAGAWGAAVAATDLLGVEAQDAVA